MEMNDYQEAARRTAVYPEDIGLIYTALGLAGESGEYVDKIKKEVRKGARNLLSTEKAERALMLELSDVLWYVALAAHELGYTLEEVAEANLEKLQDRQRRGVLKGEGDTR